MNIGSINSLKASNVRLAKQNNTQNQVSFKSSDKFPVIGDLPVIGNVANIVYRPTYAVVSTALRRTAGALTPDQQRVITMATAGEQIRNGAYSDAYGGYLLEQDYQTKAREMNVNRRLHLPVFDLKEPIRAAIQESNSKPQLPKQDEFDIAALKEVDLLCQNAQAIAARMVTKKAQTAPKLSGVKLSTQDLETLQSEVFSSLSQNIALNPSQAQSPPGIIDHRSDVDRHLEYTDKRFQSALRDSQMVKRPLPFI